MSDAHIEEPQTFVVFALPEDYAHHVGQVASVGSDGLRVVRKQLSLGAPYRIEVVPLSAVSRVDYDSSLAPWRIVAGVMVLVLLAGILVGLFVYRDDLAPGTTLRYGLLALAIVYGVNWTFRSRRHTLAFHLGDGRRMRWRSCSGDFKYKTPAAHRAIERLTELGLFAADPAAR